jgi:hypothetical protein
MFHRSVAVVRSPVMDIVAGILHVRVSSSLSFLIIVLNVEKYRCFPLVPSESFVPDIPLTPMPSPTDKAIYFFRISGSKPKREKQKSERRVPYDSRAVLLPPAIRKTNRNPHIWVGFKHKNMQDHQLAQVLRSRRCSLTFGYVESW